MSEEYMFLGGSRDGTMWNIMTGSHEVRMPLFVGEVSHDNPKERIPIERYFKVSIDTSSGVKTVFALEGLDYAEIYRLIDRPIHEVIKRHL